MARVLVIGDTHFPAVHRKYLSHLLRTRDRYKTTRVVHIGDVVDFHGISYHGKSYEAFNPQIEFEAAIKSLSKYYAEFPKAVVLTGNHDALPSRRVADVLGFPSSALRPLNELLEVPQWRFVPRYEYVEIDGVKYNHGEVVSGMHAAVKLAKAQFSNVVIGHHHSQCEVGYYANEGQCVFGMSVGCGIDRHHAAMAYGKLLVKKPILSCGVVIDGHPILVPMKI